MRLGELQTPALVVDHADLTFNLNYLAQRLPGRRLRPHVKAHKCTALARRQYEAGHRGFTCATIREAQALASAGLGQDLLLANIVTDASRLRPLREQVIVVVDSDASIDVVAPHVKDVLIDVDVGLHRTGCNPADAPRLADRARSRGLTVRGVMGYEGHAVHLADRSQRQAACDQSMAILAEVHRLVGGDIISGGGTGTWDCNTIATEIQAGSYALMDTNYARMNLPFRMALFISAHVIHVRQNHAVADCGLKALGMDSGPPTIDDATVLSVSDEHVAFRTVKPLRFGDLIRVRPAHVDPTVAYHERLHVVEGENVVETWPIDMRGW